MAVHSDRARSGREWLCHDAEQSTGAGLRTCRGGTVRWTLAVSVAVSAASWAASSSSSARSSSSIACAVACPAVGVQPAGRRAKGLVMRSAFTHTLRSRSSRSSAAWRRSKAAYQASRSPWRRSHARAELSDAAGSFLPLEERRERPVLVWAAHLGLSGVLAVPHQQGAEAVRCRPDDLAALVVCRGDGEEGGTGEQLQESSGHAAAGAAGPGHAAQHTGRVQVQLSVRSPPDRLGMPGGPAEAVRLLLLEILLGTEVARLWGGRVLPAGGRSVVRLGGLLHDHGSGRGGCFGVGRGGLGFAARVPLPLRAGRVQAGAPADLAARAADLLMGGVVEAGAAHAELSGPLADDRLDDAAPMRSVRNVEPDGAGCLLGGEDHQRVHLVRALPRGAVGVGDRLLAHPPAQAVDVADDAAALLLGAVLPRQVGRGAPAARPATGPSRWPRAASRSGGRGEPAGPSTVGGPRAPSASAHRGALRSHDRRPAR
ncbi:hypothetical protein SALBM135S_05597 [Streptomyces alboniger]